MANGGSQTCLCTVNNAGATVVTMDSDERGDGGTGPNAVTVTLTDAQEARFGNQMFVVTGMQNQILAAALTAINSGCQVAAFVDLPPYHDFVIPSCQALWVIASGSPLPI
jgi:hypothetical protein